MAPGDDSRGHGSEAVALAATLNPDLANYDSDGDILKDAPPDELLTAVRAAAAGESALAPAVAGHLLARMMRSC